MIRRTFFFSILVLVSHNIYANYQYLYLLSDKYIHSHDSDKVEKLKIVYRPIPSYLNLPTCKKPIFNFESHRHFFGQRILKVKCNKPYWQFYLQLKISAYVPVVIASKNIFFGQLLTKSNLTIKKVITDKIHSDSFTSINELKNTKAKAYIEKGAILTKNQVQINPLVSSGQLLNIVSSNDKVYVKMSGIALQSGSRGDVIKIRNSHSKKIVFGKIVSSSIVEPL